MHWYLLRITIRRHAGPRPLSVNGAAYTRRVRARRRRKHR